ncbi:hypothetical protein [Bacteroides faecis]|uniref:hypothetical protein n=1 Tax=Bacteroides faecis TaxID=674529 RepID=UPI001C8BEA24|nr:hypothetical protein [Bacteroides faecis]
MPTDGTYRTTIRNIRTKGLCHYGGTTMPPYWHCRAIALAQLCHYGGKDVLSQWQRHPPGS